MKGPTWKKSTSVAGCWRCCGKFICGLELLGEYAAGGPGQEDKSGGLMSLFWRPLTSLSIIVSWELTKSPFCPALVAEDSERYGDGDGDND